MSGVDLRSVPWKAYCFKNEALVTEIFSRDLTGEGVAFAEPGDIFTDVAWKQTLEREYPAPCIPARSE